MDLSEPAIGRMIASVPESTTMDAYNSVSKLVDPMVPKPGAADAASWGAGPRDIAAGRDAQISPPVAL